MARNICRHLLLLLLLLLLVLHHCVSKITSSVNKSGAAVEQLRTVAAERPQQRYKKNYFL
jgi:hypothetical protein